MDVHVITADGVRDGSVTELPALLAATDTIVWVDVPGWDEQTARLLAEVFGFHPLALRDCATQNRMPKVHAYPEALFLVVHAPERDEAGQVHQVELDRFVGARFLVTVHGPTDVAIPADVPLRDTRAVLERLRAGRLRPTSGFDVSHAVVSAMTRRMEAFVEGLAEEVGALEERVTTADVRRPEQFLDELFGVRHALLAVRTMAAQAREIYRRVATLSRFVPEESRPLVHDLVDQFDRIAGLAEDQRDYLQGVIEFFRARTDTKMTVAAERLAVIAVVTLPVTALASVLGMNLIVNDTTTPGPLAVAVVLMLVMSGALLRWARRQGWW